MLKSGFVVFLATLFLLPLAQYSSAQMKLNMNVIDGSKTPERIPDVVAYRLWFTALAVEQNATQGEIEQQRASITALGLSTEDAHVLMGVLSQFKSNYSSLIEEHNSLVNDLSNHPNMHVDSGEQLAQFLERRDALVNTTCEQLRRLMSPGGVRRIHILVQTEKKNMRITDSTN